MDNTRRVPKIDSESIEREIFEIVLDWVLDWQDISKFQLEWLRSQM